MSFVIDTDTCSAYLRGKGGVSNRFLQYSGGLYISVVTLAELYTWVYRAADPQKRLDAVYQMLSDVQVLPIDDDVARLFGQTQAQMLAGGLVVATPDLLIGATALVHDFTVVTHNTRHFEKIPGLRLQDWVP